MIPLKKKVEIHKISGEKKKKKIDSVKISHANIKQIDPTNGPPFSALAGIWNFAVRISFTVLFLI